MYVSRIHSLAFYNDKCTLVNAWKPSMDFERRFYKFSC